MKRTLFGMLFVISMQASAYTGFGICNFGKEKIDKVICYGPTVLKSTIVAGDVKIAGPFKAYDVSIGPLTVTGSAEIQGSTIKGDVNITGGFQATNVSIDRDLNIVGNKALLDHSSVKGAITISATDKNPQLTLQCGTTVKGSVIFTRKEGTIQITDDSLIQGGIKNGHLEFVKRNC